MKNGIILTTIAALLAAFSAYGQSVKEVGLGQRMKLEQARLTPKQSRLFVTPTAAETLNSILSETNNVPLGLYPPGFLKQLWEKGVAPAFRLHPPSGGFEGSIKRPFGSRGELGYRGAEISHLVARMM